MDEREAENWIVYRQSVEIKHYQTVTTIHRKRHENYNKINGSMNMRQHGTGSPVPCCLFLFINSNKERPSSLICKKSTDFSVASSLGMTATGQILLFCYLLCEVRLPQSSGKKTINPSPSPIGNKFGLYCFGDPYGTRTHVTAVKGRCLNHLTNGPGNRRRFAAPVVAAPGFEPGTLRV